MKSKKSVLAILEKKLKEKNLELDSLKEEILNDIIEIDSKDTILQNLNEYRKQADPLFIIIDELEDLKKEME